MRKCGKNIVQPQMAHALYMLDKWGYTHTLRICSIYSYCSLTTTVVTRTRLHGKLTCALPVMFGSQQICVRQVYW